MAGEKRKIIFFGNPEFALPSLRLLAKEFEIYMVVSNVPKPAGRGLKVRKTPIQILAEELGLPVAPVASRAELVEVCQKAASAGVDVGVVVAFGRIIPTEVLNIFKYSIIGVHPSLLPRWRGPDPIRRAILEGDTYTGVTVFKLTEEVDAGPIFLQQKVEIDEKYFDQLSSELADLGAKLALEVLRNIESLKPIPQEGEPTYASVVSKYEMEIDWSKPSDQIERLVRALSKRPGAYTYFNKKRLKILRVRKSNVFNFEASAGTVKTWNDRMFVKTWDGAIEILELQPEGKRAMSASEFIRGYHPDGVKLWKS